MKKIILNKGGFMLNLYKYKSFLFLIIFIVLFVSLTGCSSTVENYNNQHSLFIRIITLEFLPSGMRVISDNNESLMQQSSILNAVIPIVGLLINYLIAIIVNIIDFIIWIFSWVPGYRSFINRIHHDRAGDEAW